ncbi:MAG: hypothetical protein SNJ78_05650, partial [Spirochaetales bacterium]
MKTLLEKFSFFEAFWKSEGPFPLLFARPHLAKGKNYFKYNLVEQHYDPVKLIEEAVLAAQSALEGGDDGIPAFRTDLGTTLFPSSLGLEIVVQPEAHPWLKSHLTFREYATLKDPTIGIQQQAGEIGLAIRTYQLFLKQKASGLLPHTIYPYMFHAHGMISGVWFPDTGARISEDSCTLISDRMNDEFCMPYIR